MFNCLVFSNYNITEIVTPVKVDKLQQLLQDSKYNKIETEFIINGFRYGFPIGYQGQKIDIQRRSPNLKFEVGDESVLCEKVMKEVEKGRFSTFQ